MGHPLLARVALSSVCVVQPVLQLAIDTGRTHAKNPLWVGHARFHVVWQSLTVAGISCVELALLWLRFLPRDQSFYLALTLTAVSPLAFLVTLATRRIFAGTLCDPNGVPPLRLGRTLCIDLNVVGIAVALLTIAASAALYH